MYKVFLVEDEIVTREGIRNSVRWNEVGFQYVGDAPDGETALPLILDARPDIVITDIQMPFMDGLELAQILRRELPDLKIIILSGHDEFEYAQQAIPLEVSSYQLKPVTRQELIDTLQQVASQIDVERQEKATHLELLDKSKAYHELLQEKFMLRLVTGGLDTAEALAQSERLNTNIVAQRYLVIVMVFEPICNPLTVDYQQYQSLKQAAVSAIENNPDVLWFFKDIDELVLLIKGKESSPLETEAEFLSNLVADSLPDNAECRVNVGVGTVCERVTELNESYSAARANLDNPPKPETGQLAEHIVFQIIKRKEIERFLNLEDIERFEEFFDEMFGPLQEAIDHSTVYRNYVLTHAVFTCAHFVRQLGGNAFHVLNDIDYLEKRLAEVRDFDGVREMIRETIRLTFEYRDEQVDNLHNSIIWEAKAYLEDNFHDADISLQDVANHVNLSISHFSRIFRREVGATFIEYLTDLRIERAKVLLCTTSMRAYEVAESVGYNDPHYFSTVFKRCTGRSPSEYQEQKRSGQPDCSR